MNPDPTSALPAFLRDAIRQAVAQFVADRPVVADAWKKRYTRLTFFAAGGMGEIWRAFDEELQREVAIKIPLAGGGPLAAERLREEAQILARLGHGAIVPVHDVGELEDGRPFFVMMFICGATLEEELQRRDTPRDDEPRLLHFFERICRAVAGAHAHVPQILHRDLKPVNVRVTPDGEVFVLDWGIARLLDERAERPLGAAPAALARRPGWTPVPHRTPTQTRAGKGTPGFMAPEQAPGRHEQIGPWTDVFALGGILFQMLTGSADPPYHTGARTPAEIATALADTHSALAASGAAPELVALAVRCLQPDTRDRPADAAQLLDELEAARSAIRHRLERAEQNRQRAEVQVREERKRRKWQAALAVSLLVLGALAGAGAWWRQTVVVERERQVLIKVVAVEAALLQVKALQDRGLWAAAEELLDHTEKQLGPGGPAAVRDRIAQARTDLRFVTALSRIRQERSAIVESGSGPLVRRTLDPGPTNAKYEQTFRAFGLDPVGGEPAEVAQRLAASAVRTEVLAALDDWALGEARPDQRQRLDRVAAAVAADPWREELSRLGDRPSLARKADELAAAGGTPAHFIRLAQALDNAGGDSLPLLEAGCRRHPGDFWLHVECARRYDDPPHKRSDAAAGSLRTALALQPESAAIWNDLGVVLLGRKDYRDAATCFRTALGFDRGVAHFHNNLGLALKNSKLAAEALDSFRTAVALDPDSAVFRNGFAAALLDAGDLDAAAAAAERALRIDPKYPPALNTRALVRMAQKNVEDAVTDLRAATRLNENVPHFHVNLAIALKQKNDPNGAVVCLKKALVLDPNFGPAHYNLAIIHYARKDVPAAIDSYRAAIRCAPLDTSAYVNLGTVYREARDPDKAIGVFRDALRVAPDDATLHTELGTTLYYDKRDAPAVVEAIACFQTAVRLDPKSLKAQTNLGFALYVTRSDLGGAVACFRAALAIDPSVPKHHANLGGALHAQKKLVEAAVCYHAALKLDPGYRPAHLALGAIACDAKDFVKAIEHFNDAKAILNDPAIDVLARQAARWRDLQSKMPGILTAAVVPTGTAERLEWADYCANFHDAPRAAVGFYRDAFAADPRLADDAAKEYRYAAACCAARVIGRGEGGKQVSKTEARELAREALAWLRADLAFYTKEAARPNPGARLGVFFRLTHWQHNPDLAAVRDNLADIDLPGADREQWNVLWGDAERLRKQVAGIE